MNSTNRFAWGIALLVILSALPAFAQWSDAVLDSVTNTLSRKETNEQSLAVDQFGQAHLVWSEARPDFSGWRLFYSTRLFHAEWTPPQEIGDSTRGVFSPALTISPDNNRPYVAYEDSGEIYVAQLVNGVWEHARVTEDTLADCCPTIAADSTGLVHLAWVTQDSAGVYRIAYAIADSNVWVPEVLAGSELGEFGTGADPEIAVSPGGTPHIIYRGGNYLSYRIHHAWAQDLGGERVWNYEILESPEAEDLTGSIAVEDEGELHIAVSGSGGFGFPSRAYYFHQPVGGSWSQPEAIAPELGATDPQIELDQAGEPHVIWSEISGNFYTGNIFYSVRHGENDWASEQVIGPNSLAPSFEIDRRSFGHLAFYQSDELGTAYDIFYLQSTVPLFGAPVLEVAPDTLDFGNVAVGDSAFLALTISNTGTEPVTILEINTPASFRTDLTDSVTIAPDSAIEVMVVFRPDSAMTITGILQVVPSAGPVVEVVLTGQGIGLSAEEPDLNSVPGEFYLAQNYPNPFNPSTTFEFGLPSNAHVEIRVHDLLGREVAVLVSQVMPAGHHRVTWECRECASGTYIVVLSAPELTIHRKATLVR